MAEVHLIGQIIGGSGFDDKSLFAKWSLHTNSNWTLLEGSIHGQTHLSNIIVDYPISSQDEIQKNKHFWNHPIDVHYLTKGLQGWPKLEFQVWGVDWMGKSNICSYGFINVPMQPGYHNFNCYTWRPVGDIRRRIVDYVTGYRMHLVDPSDPIINGLNRHSIQAQSMGSISIGISVVLKSFETLGLDL